MFRKMQWFMITGSKLHQTLALVPFRGHFVTVSAFLLIFFVVVLWCFCLCLLFGVFFLFVSLWGTNARVKTGVSDNVWMYNLQENGIQLELLVQDMQSFVCNNVSGYFDHLDEFSILKAKIISIMSP